MKATELRKGNLIEHIDWKNEVVEFVCLDFEAPDHRLYWKRLGSKEMWDMASPIGGDYTKPLPLTEEWLLKFGFEYKERIFYKGRIDVDNMMGHLYNLRIRTDNDNSTFANYVPNVHQLQNLYFALTGEELTITE